MKKTLTLLLMFLSTTAYADFTKMKPGLWQMESTISINGQEINVGGLLGSAMKALPEDMQNKAKDVSGVKLNDKGILVCLTADMIKKPESLADQNKEQVDCKVKITKQSNTKIEGTVECPKPKSTAKLEYTYISPTEYRGKIQITAGEGKTMTSNISGKFLRTDCGDVQADKK